ncbi:DUF695 domain-containing protein [Phaeodactylibacter xiamenensis]|uniref:DUF695 domain-containing protein n=1 Tax=Phaeodactylibacter xiamenensis TaxID=1524460 RepID=UPI003BA86147
MRYSNWLFPMLLLLLSGCGDVGPQQQKSEAPPLPGHEERWSVFLRQQLAGPQVVTVDQGWSEQAPLQTHPRLLKVTVKANETLPTGFPTEAETRMANELQDQLLQKLERGNFGVFVGSIVVPGEKQLYYYLRAEPQADELAQETVAAYTKRKVEAAIAPDDTWSAYTEQLFPNQREQAEINNDGVLIRLQEAGDPLSQPRPIEHWAYFKSTKARSVFQDSLKRYSFEPIAYDTLAQSQMPYGIHFVRQDSIHTPYIHDLTWGLTQLAAGLGGAYDGWETIVVKPR